MEVLLPSLDHPPLRCCTESICFRSWHFPCTLTFCCHGAEIGGLVVKICLILDIYSLQIQSANYCQGHMFVCLLFFCHKRLLKRGKVADLCFIRH